MKAEVRRRNAPLWKHQRYMILFMLHQDRRYAEIEQRLDCVSHTIKKWKDRYLAEGLSGLQDRPRPGHGRTPPRIEARVCAQVQKKPPKGYSHWTAPLISKRTGVPERTVQKILKRNNLRPHLHGTFMVSNDPDFEEKATDIIGLYMNPPQNAVVLCVDEKTQIQALDRLQPNLPLKPGYLERRTFEYQRHGITNLSAAFNIADGKVIAQTRPTRNQNDFIDFLDKLVAIYGANRETHIILDNLSIHKTQKVRDWLAAHPSWHFHFTPTYSSWLNQIEIWFSLISRQCIRRGVFHSVRDLISKIKAYIEKYNSSAQPFQWIADDPGRRITEPIAGGLH
ncbi:MAG: IS630 family transposase [Leptospiraceae bacterium]|nr:IS630 family transposase [Leptospiraceae bacterium]